MPPVVNKATGETLNVSDETAARMVETGRYSLGVGATITAVGERGSRKEVDERSLRSFALRPSTAAEDNEVAESSWREREYGDGLMNKAQALGGGFAKGLSFGFVNPWEDEQAENSTLSTIGEIGGVALPAFFTGGGSLVARAGLKGGGVLAKALALTPSGMVARGGARIAGSAAGAGGVRALGATAAAGAFEGAAGNAGYYLSSVAHGDVKLSAEGFVGATGQGALWGGGAGALAHGVARGFVTARSMFPRLAGGKATKVAAEAAEATFATQADDVLSATDELIKAARGKLASLKVPKAEADVALAKAMQSGDKEAIAAARAQLSGIRVAGAEAKLTIASKGAPRSPAPVGTPVSIPGGAATADDAVRAMGVVDEAAPSPVLAEGSSPVTREAERLTRTIEQLEAGRTEVRTWLEQTRAIADKGRWIRRTAEDGQWARGNADLHVDIVGKTPDEILAWRRPHIDDISVREDYDEMIRRAAGETDEAARDALTREAAELEVQAFDAAPNALNKETLAARTRLSTDPVELAKRRIQRDIDAMTKMDPDDVGYYITGQRHPNAGKQSRYQPTTERGISRRAGDDMFARADADMMRTGNGTAGVMDDATARVNRWRAEGKLQPPGGLVDAAEQGIDAIGNLERANADLVNEMGSAAPVASKALADDYAKAIDEQARKSTDRMAQVADDANAAPIAMGKGKGKKAAEVPEVEERGRMGLLGDVAAGAELLQSLGVAGIPDVDRIPVIGPLLGGYLKIRAARAMVGKMGGRIPATAEAKIAGKAAATRDRAAAAVDRMLATGAQVAARAARVAPRGAALAHMLYDDGVTRAAATSDGEAARHRMAELAAATADPDGVKRAVRKSLADAHDPDLVRAVEVAVLRKLQYLAANMPKEPPPSLLGNRKWTPSKVEIDRFARRVKAAEDPASVFEDLATGTVTPEAAETLREVYPGLFAEAQTRLVERAAEVDEVLPYQRVIKLSVLFDVPLVPSMRPERIAAYQASAPKSPAAPQGPSPMSGPPPAIDSLYTSSADRRGSRR